MPVSPANVNLNQWNFSDSTPQSITHMTTAHSKNISLNKIPNKNKKFIEESYYKARGL